MDPRIERTRTAVMDAATQLLLERGPDGLTMDGVVARSGVAKSTLYRHWPTRDALVAAVFEHLAPSIEPPDASLPYDAALRALVRSLAHVLADEQWKPLIPAITMLKAQHPDLADLDSSLAAQQAAVLGPVLRKGIAEGRLRPDLDHDVIATFLVGPLLMAALTGQLPVDDALADAVADQFLVGTAPR